MYEIVRVELSRVHTLQLGGPELDGLSGGPGTGLEPCDTES